MENVNHNKSSKVFWKAIVLSVVSYFTWKLLLAPLIFGGKKDFIPPPEYNNLGELYSTGDSMDLLNKIFECVNMDSAKYYDIALIMITRDSIRTLTETSRRNEIIL